MLEASVTAFYHDDDDLIEPLPHPSAQRTLVVTDAWVVERNQELLNVSSRRPLSQLHALLRDPRDEQSFGLQYKSGSCRNYTSASRDAILASILEAAHAAAPDATLRRASSI